MLAGQLLGKAAVCSGKNAVQTQSYGAEARGSAAKSEVIISDGKIGFPMVRKCDILVAMSQEAVEKNLEDLRKEGLLLVDSTIVKSTPKTEAKILEIPATETSQKTFGKALYANIIVLGALTEVARIADKRCIEKAIKDTLSERLVDVNIKAYKKGKELIGAQESQSS